MKLQPMTILFLVLIVVTACGDSTNNGITISDTTDAGNEDTSIEADTKDDASEIPGARRDHMGTIGGDRPVQATFPADYDVEGNHPLLIQLHGVGSNSIQTEAFFGTASEANARGVVTLTPEGTTGSQGQFWNATEVCCDFQESGIDDVSYLSELVEEAIEKYAVDPDRIFLMGLSNGGYMSHRMACDRGDLIRGIVSFNGSSFRDAADCPAEDPVQIIHIHATADQTVAYEGDFFVPSAREVVERWVDWNDCDPDPIDGPAINVTTTVSGDETTTEIWENCVAGGEVEFWTIHDGAHVPYPLADFPELIFDTLLPD